MLTISQASGLHKRLRISFGTAEEGEEHTSILPVSASGSCSHDQKRPSGWDQTVHVQVRSKFDSMDAGNSSADIGLPFIVHSTVCDEQHALSLRMLHYTSVLPLLGW